MSAWKLAVAAAFTGLLIVVVFTRFGVFLAFDVLGDLGTDDLDDARVAGQRSRGG